MYNDIPTNKEILKYQKEGHTFHCAMRILTGDGECECNKVNNIPGGISRRMYQGRCFVCLEPEQNHKEWCRNAKQPINSLDAKDRTGDKPVEVLFKRKTWLKYI